MVKYTCILYSEILNFAVYDIYMNSKVLFLYV